MKATASRNKTEWLIPAALILLSFVPAVAGTLRIAQLTGGAAITPENVRFFASPLPVTLHIISAILFSILGAFQFAPSFRRRRSKWHRAAGRLLIPSGLIVALSGLWMAHFYPWPEGDGELLYGLRLLFGTAMVLSIVLSVVAIRRHDFAQHGIWMIRAYAIGLGAGTQFFTHIAWILMLGTPDEFTRALLMGAGWIINLAVAEWIISRRPTRSTRTSPAAV